VRNIRFLLLVLFLVISKVTFGQNPYYDAIFLEDHTVIHNGKLYIKLEALKRIADHLFNYLPKTDLENYKGEEMADAEVARLLRQGFETNPFFSVNAYLPGVKLKAGRFAVNSMKLVPSDIGGLGITNLADGVSKVLVERVKQELSLAFFDHFKKDLSKYPDLLTLFPYTYHVLITIGSEIYNFTAYIDMLREAFLKDFQLLIPNIKKVIENPDYKEYFSKTPQLYSIIQVAFQIVDDYQSEDHPGDIITHLADMDTSILDCIDPNMKPSFQVMDIMVQSFRSQITDQYTVPFDSVRKNILNRPTALKIYMGLLYQTAKNKKILFKNNGVPVDFCTILDSAYIPLEKKLNTLYTYKRIIEDIMCSAEAVQQALSLSERGELTDTKANYKDYFGFYYASLSLIRNIGTIPDSLGNNTPFKLGWGRNKSTCLFVIDKMSEIHLDISETRYSSAILNATSVYDTIFAGYGKKFSKIGALILKYGNFAALVSKAETSDQVKEAMETVILPAGSSRIKRESAFNISLNAYVAGFYGNEKFSFTLDNVKKVQWRPTAGLTAPIGIAFSTSSDYPFGKGWRSSFSLFASVIDLGAFTSFRFNDSISNIQPKITIENIFSPGLYFVYGIPKTPLSIGAGWQYGPALRKIDSSSAVIDPKRYSKWCIFAGVDIPLLNLYSKPKR
jgi:hypothetical protein